MSARPPLDLAAISARLQALNPHLTAIHAEPATQPGLDVEVVITTTRAELDGRGGRLRLSDPALNRLQIQITIQVLDPPAGEPVQFRFALPGPSQSPVRVPPR